jgi:hypothetical protein
MKCVVCGNKLGNPGSIDDIKIKIHEDCLTEDMNIAFRGAVSPFIYNKDGKLIKGYFHKPHEEL